MVLVAVMWMVAALSLLASSLIFSTRTEIHSVHQLREATEAVALGDAAIRLAALDLRESRVPANRWSRSSYVFEGREIRVTVVPSAGLVNLNKAEPALLADLFVHAGGVHPERAAQLAEMVRAHRQPLYSSDLAVGADGEAARRIQRRLTRFDVPEDLLGIEGVDLELYDRLADLVTVQSSGGRVHPAAAPPELVAVLAGGDLQAAQRFILGRESNDPTTDTTGLNHVTPAVPSDPIYRFDAEFRSDRGIVYRRSAWADLSRRNEPLPYRLLEVHPVRSIAVGAPRR